MVIHLAGHLGKDRRKWSQAQPNALVPSAWGPLQGPGQLISLIEETTSTECRQEVATTLLKLFLGQGLAKDFLDLLFQLELSRTCEAWEGVAC